MFRKKNGAPADNSPRDWKGLRRKVVRAAKALLLPAIAAFGLSSSVMSVDPPPADQPLAGNPQDSPSLQALKAEFGRVALGRDMLAFADGQGVTIVESATGFAKETNAAYWPDQKIIQLRPGVPVEDAMISLAHELRHVWQHAVLRYPEMEVKNLTPEQSWTYRRFLEADARAFGIYYKALRICKLEEKAAAEGMNAFTIGQAEKLCAEMKGWGRLTHDEYRDIAVVPSFGMLANYNGVHLKQPMQKAQKYVDLAARAERLEWKGDRKGARRIVREIEKAFSDKMPEAEFTAELRRFGGIGLDPLAPTSLQDEDVTEENLRRDYARASVGNHEKISKMDEELRNIADLQKDVEKYVESFNTKHSQPKKKK